MTAVESTSISGGGDRTLAGPLITVVIFVGLVCAALALSGALAGGPHGGSGAPAGHQAVSKADRGDTAAGGS